MHQIFLSTDFYIIGRSINTLLHVFVSTICGRIFSQNISLLHVEHMLLTLKHYYRKFGGRLNIMWQNISCSISLGLLQFKISLWILCNSCKIKEETPCDGSKQCNTFSYINSFTRIYASCLLWINNYCLGLWKVHLERYFGWKSGIWYLTY